jgi:hypothetical protein
VATPASVAVAGTYQLIVVNSSGCSDTAVVILIKNAQLCPPVIEKITISPNPAIDKLNISIARQNAVKIEILVHNAAGQKVYSKLNQQTAGIQNYTVPMKQFTAGVYYVTVIINDKSEVVKKIMKR